MTKYKYRVEARPNGRDLADWLNEHAADGWRLVHVAAGPDGLTGHDPPVRLAGAPLYYFEREVSESDGSWLTGFETKT